MELTVDDLRDLRDRALADPLSPEDAVKVFVKWFTKKAERILKSAAQFGYSVATLDLPIELAAGGAGSLHSVSPADGELARKLDKTLAKSICIQVKEILPGCSVAIVEEEYEGQTLYRLEVGW